MGLLVGGLFLNVYALLSALGLSLVAGCLLTCWWGAGIHCCLGSASVLGRPCFSGSGGKRGVDLSGDPALAPEVGYF